MRYIYTLKFIAGISYLLITSSNAKDFNKTSTMLDGLKLEVEFSSDAKSDVARAECKLTNTTSDPVTYDNTGFNFGFVFKLVDLSGNEIEKNVAWKKFYEASDVSRHSATIISPNETLTYSLSFKEAFSAPVKSGYRLIVQWDPGVDGRGDPLRTGRGLAATLELKLEEGEIGNDVSEPRLKYKAVEASGHAVTTTQEPALKKTTTPWAIVAVMIVAGIGLVWLVLKRRS